MPWIDISVPLGPGLPSWNDEPVRIEQTLAIADGDTVNLTEIGFPVHTGTHVDAPCHFVDGAPTLEQVPLETWIGPALVVDATEAEARIGRALVERLVPSGTERVLFKTRNADLWDRGRFSHDYVCLDRSGAAALAGRGARLAGIDYLTIADDEGHRVLFRAGVAALEGLDLRAVAVGRYELVCLPLSIPGADGAPARALLRPV
jgi:arylformamidase